MNLLEALKSGKKFKRANTNYWMSQLSNEENTCGCYFPILKEIVITKSLEHSIRIAGHIQPIIAEDIIAEDYELKDD